MTQPQCVCSRDCVLTEDRHYINCPACMFFSPKLLMPMGAQVPDPYSSEWLFKRRARIVYRTDLPKEYAVKPENLSSQGREVLVHQPRVMDSIYEGGHSLYAGDVCWDIVNKADDEPVYLSEKDLIWL